MLTVLNRWSNVIAIFLSIVALAFSVATYWRVPHVAYEKIRFHIGVAYSLAEQTMEFCKEASTEGGIALCQNYIETSKKHISILRNVINSQIDQLSADDYKTAMLAVSSARAMLATALLYSVGNKKQDEKNK